MFKENMTLAILAALAPLAAQAETTKTVETLTEVGAKVLNASDATVSVPAYEILKIAKAAQLDGLDVKLVGPNAEDGEKLDIKFNLKKLPSSVSVKNSTLDPSWNGNAKGAACTSEAAVANWFGTAKGTTCDFW